MGSRLTSAAGLHECRQHNPEHPVGSSQVFRKKISRAFRNRHRFPSQREALLRRQRDPLPLKVRGQKFSKAQQPTFRCATRSAESAEKTRGEKKLANKLPILHGQPTASFDARHPTQCPLRAAIGLGNPKRTPAPYPSWRRGLFFARPRPPRRRYGPSPRIQNPVSAACPKPSWSLEMTESGCGRSVCFPPMESKAGCRPIASPRDDPRR